MECDPPQVGYYCTYSLSSPRYRRYKLRSASGLGMVAQPTRNEARHLHGAVHPNIALVKNAGHRFALR